MLLLVVIAALRGAPLAGDPFARNDTLRLLRLNNLPAFDLAALRVFHARHSAPVEIGLFGNSHIIQVAATDLNRAPGTLYNYAIPGSSFRQSVNMVEALAAIDRRPATIVISLDHFALNHVAAPEYPGLPQRVGLAIGDVGLLLRQGNLRLAVNATINSIDAEWRALREAASFAALRARLSVWLPEIVRGPRQWKLGFRSDGSRAQESVQEQKRFSLPLRTPFILWRSYLTRDFARLASATNGMARVVIFESMLAPNIELVGPPAAAAAVSELRSLFLSLCQQHGFSCDVAPDAAARPDNTPWLDCCHAPPAVLAARIDTLLGKASAR